MRRHGPFTHSLDVLRPDDLLVLRFGFVNLRPDPDARDRLVRIDSAADAIVVVTFQPQHVQDRPFEERQDDKGNLLYQEPVDPPPWSRSRPASPGWRSGCRPLPSCR